MISFIRGKIINKTLSQVVIETFGIGFEILISSKTYEKLPKVNEEACIETYMHVRDDLIVLIGFLDSNEKELFLKLISVSGVSIKIALSILSIYNTDELIRIIKSQEAELLKKVPGVGDKLANRIILELKGKLKGDYYITKGTEKIMSNSKIMDVKEALKTLGYSNSEVQLAFSKLELKSIEEQSVEDLLKAALKEIKD
jgi:Holliday junction DNA helicase RuvA